MRLVPILMLLPLVACEVKGEDDADGDGFVASEDCDDGDASIHPDAAEVCDGADNDCDGLVDGPDAEGAAPFFADDDGDGYGDAGTVDQGCEVPEGWVADNTDCDDAEARVNPAADERCDTPADDDCDGEVNEADAVDVITWYTDADSDGYGDPETGAASCEPPTGAVEDASDCDDTDPAVHPLAEELCATEADDDCDGEINEDDATDAVAWYDDSDGDGFGAPGAFVVACEAPAGGVADDTDCDDLDADTFPGAPEWCDRVDTDCDGLADPTDAVTLFDGSGAPTDATSTFAGGSATSPATVTLTQAGTYGFCEGTWYLALTIGAADVVLEGAGEGLTVLSGGGSGRPLKATSVSGLEVHDLTISNGVGDLSGGNGGCVALNNAQADFSGVTVEDCVNAGGSGGGLSIEDSTVTMLDSTIRDNAVTVTSGGGVLALSSSVTFDNVTVEGNVGRFRGGAMYVSDTALTITNGSFADNSCTLYDGGAIRVYDGSVVVVTGTAFTNNAANAYGGAIASNQGASMTFTNAQFTGNSASRGGAIWLNDYSDSLSVTTSGFSGNTPQDVYTGSNSYSWGTSSSFACSGGSCN